MFGRDSSDLPVLKAGWKWSKVPPPPPNMLGDDSAPELVLGTPNPWLLLG